MPGPNLFEDPGWDVQGQCLTGWAQNVRATILFKGNALCIFCNSCLRQTTCFSSLVRL